MDTADGWLALDKLEHFLLCFFLTVIFSLLVARFRLSLIRNRSIWVGSILSLVAGAAKEIADEMGYFQSSGGSVKDAIFDFLGTVVAALGLYLSKSYYIPAVHTIDSAYEVKSIEMV